MLLALDELPEPTLRDRACDAIASDERLHNLYMTVSRPGQCERDGVAPEFIGDVEMEYLRQLLPTAHPSPRQLGSGRQGYSVPWSPPALAGCDVDAVSGFTVCGRNIHMTVRVSADEANPCEFGVAELSYSFGGMEGHFYVLAEVVDGVVSADFALKLLNLTEHQIRDRESQLKLECVTDSASIIDRMSPEQIAVFKSWDKYQHATFRGQIDELARRMGV